MATLKAAGARIKARVKMAEKREIMAEKKILRDVKRIAGRTAQRAVALGIRERGAVRRGMKTAEQRIHRRAAGARRRGAAAVKRIEEFGPGY